MPTTTKDRDNEVHTTNQCATPNNGAGLGSNVRSSQSKKAKHLRSVLRELNSHLPPAQRGKFNNGRYTTAGDVRRLLEEVREYL